MFTTAYRFLHFRTYFLLLPWKLRKNFLFGIFGKIFGPILLNFSCELNAKSGSFMAKTARISRFPRQPIGILEFRFRSTDPWPEQIVRAKFRRDPSRNQGGDANHPSPAHKITKKNSVLQCRMITKAPNGFYSDLPTRCIKSTQRALLSQIADIICSINLLLWLHMEILHHYHLRCCLYNQWELQDLRWKDGQPTWRNPFRAFWTEFVHRQMDLDLMILWDRSFLHFSNG